MADKKKRKGAQDDEGPHAEHTKKPKKSKKQQVEVVDAVQAEAASKNRPEAAATEPMSHGQADGADLGAEGGRGRSRSTISLVPPETSKYLSEISDHFKTLIDNEEKQLLIANVLEEIAGKEQLVAGDPTCSRHIEQLLAVATTSQLLGFLSAALPNGGITQMACSPFGSHVAEKLLIRLGQAYDHMTQAEYDSFSQVLQSITEEVCGDLWSFLGDRFATHVARRVLCVLCGADILSAGARGPTAATTPGAAAAAASGGEEATDADAAEDGAARGRRGGKAAGVVPGTAVSGLAARLTAGLGDAGAGAGGKKKGGRGQGPGSGAHPGAGAGTCRFPDQVQALLKVLGAEDSPLGDAVYDKYASPFVQAGLRAAALLPNSRNALTALVPATLSASYVTTDANKTGKILEGVSKATVTAMMEDPTASHVVEVVITVAPTVPGLLDEIVNRFFVGDLKTAATHATSNYCVQALVSACTTQPQVMSVFNELSPLLSDLLRKRRGGVVAALVAACGRVVCCQKELCAALSAALTQHPPWQGQPATKVLAAALVSLDCPGAPLPTDASAALPDVAALCTARKQHPLVPRLSTLGGAILINILKFQQGACRDFTDSLLSLPSSSLALVARDPAGARALEAVVDGSAPAKVKAKLLESMTGGWAVAASSGAGSFFVEKCYTTAADEQVKESIVRELVAAEKPLGSTHWGSKVLQRVGAEAYKRDPQQWRRSAQSSTKTLAAFENLFGSPKDKVNQDKGMDKDAGVLGGAADRGAQGRQGEASERQKKGKKRKTVDAVEPEAQQPPEEVVEVAAVAAQAGADGAVAAARPEQGALDADDENAADLQRQKKKKMDKKRKKGEAAEDDGDVEEKEQEHVPVAGDVVMGGGDGYLLVDHQGEAHNTPGDGGGNKVVSGTDKKSKKGHKKSKGA